MKNITLILLSVFVVFVTLKSGSSSAETKAALFLDEKNTLIQNTRQLTFVGPRSGEGYFSQDGQKMIFQSEREPNNPFYQMYVLDLKSGQSTRVSTGQGKTTCGWIRPDLKKVLWSSTHLDKDLKKKVKAEYEERAKPVKGRYSWSFDDQFEIFESDLQGNHRRQLTHSLGYDAEASYSPDGKWIAFASNRSMYPGEFQDTFTADEKKLLEKDPSYAMEIYIMKADGTGVKRLTHSPGYDGGPFFSADGQKITWRRFSADGRLAEIYTMNIDGSEQRPVTHLGSMSWAPFFHPSGKYIIFSSSVLGYSNFELFIVDTAGQQKPVRVTFADGFDGLASFSPDGKTMTWSHRNEKGESQIYLADWDHQQALKLLHLDQSPVVASAASAQSSIQNKSQLVLSERTADLINESDVRSIVKYLASEDQQGRMTGSAEEKVYTQEIANLFKAWGLKPVFKDYIQPFEFTSAIRATDNNKAALKGRLDMQLKRGEDYQVLSYSKTGSFAAAPIVFAGYGLKSSATEKIAAFDSYRDIDVKGKWVLLLDGVPETDDKELKHHWLSFSRPQHKITVAKNQGAAGVIFISEGSLKDVKFEGTLSESTLPVLKMSSGTVDRLLKKADGLVSTPESGAEKITQFQQLKTLFENQKQKTGFLLSSQYLSAEVDLVLEKSTGRNVIAMLEPMPSSDKKRAKEKALLVGAHGDHLGRGERTGSSLARADEKMKVHYGADDNASGVSGVLELARYFADPVQRKKLKRPIYFAIWSGEEIGVLGSNYFVKSWKENKKTEFKQAFEAGLNMDMIGRLREQLQVQGVSSASEWAGLSEEVGLLSGVPLVLTNDPYLPTDAMSIYLGEIPSISFFTGSHEEYHSPRDTAETLNYPGLVKTIQVVEKYAEKIATVSGRVLKYQKVEGNSGQKLEGRQFRIYLGTIPDYSQEGVKGVRVSGASKNSPAEKAGIKTGDVIVEFDQTKIENLYDYVYSLQSAKPNKPTRISVLRQGQKVDLEIIPVLKE